MNIGGITSIISCPQCGDKIEIYPSQENVKCCICGACINLKMRNLVPEEEKSYEKGLEKISKPTGIKLFDN